MLSVHLEFIVNVLKTSTLEPSNCLVVADVAVIDDTFKPVSHGSAAKAGL